MKLFTAKCHEAGNITKAVTSNGEQFTVTREMLTVVARDQRVQLKSPDVVAGISARFFTGLTHWFCYITRIVPWGTVNFVSLESQCFPSTLRFSDNKIHSSPRDHVIRSVN